MRRPDPGIAAVLALVVPGLGHVYAGSIAFGLVYFFGVPFLGAVGWLLGGIAAKAAGADPMLGLALGGLAPLVLWVAQVYSAHSTATAVGRRATATRRRRRRRSGRPR